MKAVTIISPGFEQSGEEAVRRFREHAGVEVDVLRCDAATAHRVKLQAFADASKHGWRWWFDADWWLLRPCAKEIRGTLGPWVAGTPIPVDQARAEGREYGFDPRCRVTTGFIAFDPSLPQWNRAMKLALDLQAARGAGRDEVYLNAALHHFDIPVRTLDSGWNWCLQATTLYGYVPPIVHAIHAAGVPMAEKQARLDKEATTYEDLRNPWSIDARELTWLTSFARSMHEAGLRHVVEFGPGSSTHALMSAGGTITTCETDPRACCIATASLPERCDVKLIPYQPGLGGLEAPCDWALVDAPAGHLLVDGKSRWYSLEWCSQRCRLIVLHDSKRPGEQASIVALEAMGWSTLHIDTPRGLCVLTHGPEAAALAARATSP
ncbi:MAG: hypothetical protein JWO08_4024 [Verrucomicrobiaceae bacterium]|nr:hypothetical protein [Verrucomicrobiaceae bacterium]